MTAQSRDSSGPSGAEAPSLPARRSKEVSRAVRLADRAADALIPAGGLFVIFAVFGIMAFLLAVVLPLFQGGRLTAQADYAAGGPPGPVLMAEVDEYKALAITVSPSGAVSAFHAPTGSALAAPAFDFGGKRATAYARTFKGGNAAFGFEDGTVRFGRITFKAEILAGGSAPPGLKPLDRVDRTDGSAVFTPLPGGQVRKVALALALGPPQQIAEAGTAIAAMDYRVGGTVERPTRAFVTVDARGNARLSLAETRINMLTRKATTAVNTAVLEEMPRGGKVAGVLLTDRADQVYVAEEGGTVFRFDTRDFARPALAERKALFPAGVRLTALAFLIGEQSIIAAGSDGAVDVYFRLRRQGAAAPDGFEMVRAHRLEPHAGPVRGLDVSKRSKMLVTADDRGNVWLRHATSEQVILRMRSGAEGKGYDAISLAPREDGVLAVAADRRAALWSVHAPHPETTWHSLFGKVWYEGYPEPSYTWQSSSGTDTFEPKLSLVPLVFGTIKATLYSLLFAIPIALLAAVYTSEFVHPIVRGTLKPVMEMMASLPSVVLGFIAALILAPIVERWIASVLLLFLLLPLCLVGSAYLWQLVPLDRSRRLDGLPKFALMFVSIFAAFGLSYLLGARFEQLFFHGDLKAWVNGDVGTGAPFLFLVFLPGACLAVFLGARRWLEDWTRGRVRRLSEFRCALFDGARWLALLAVSALAAWAAAAAAGLGLDPRGGVVGTYVQRNVLVVGFAMGFAVIPIIYTIAEDALNAVPSHLRAASLACGATPWQTAWRVVLPTAMSGVFAAVMVGMGRAVGETMIVVMAAGNTPILDWNLFNGLRALSANIAVELPEAVKDGTLYRVLFLAGLTLFAMTFILNTLAEIVRIRFRRWAVQL
jgi:phosphate transport system permease protein